MLLRLSAGGAPRGRWSRSPLSPSLFPLSPSLSLAFSFLSPFLSPPSSLVSSLLLLLSSFSSLSQPSALSSGPGSRMGVPALFRWLTSKYPRLTEPAVEERPREINHVMVPPDSSKPNPSGFETDNLYLDMNGIIHPCSHPEDKVRHAQTRRRARRGRRHARVLSTRRAQTRRRARTGGATVPTNARSPLHALGQPAFFLSSRADMACALVSGVCACAPSSRRRRRRRRCTLRS